MFFAFELPVAVSLRLYEPNLLLDPPVFFQPVRVEKTNPTLGVVCNYLDPPGFFQPVGVEKKDKPIPTLGVVCNYLDPPGFFQPVGVEKKDKPIPTLGVVCNYSVLLTVCTSLQLHYSNIISVHLQKSS